MATKLSPMAIIKKYFHSEGHPCTMDELKKLRQGISTEDYKKFALQVAAELGADIEVDFSTCKETPAEVADALLKKAAGLDQPADVVVELAIEVAK